MTIQIEATEQYFPVVLFIMLYKMILTLESVIHWSASLSMANNLDVISLTALRVGELGNKSIKAWPCSKDCAKLGSSGIEPEKKGKM